MGVILTYPFDNPSNYTYDPTKLEVVGSQSSLKLQVATLPFEQTFDNDTGFSYDATKAEFVGGQVRQKSKRPADATFYAAFTSVNASWGDGDPIGALGGSATISGGKLDVPAVIGSVLAYASPSNLDLVQTGCVRFKFTPNYTGSPSGSRFLFSMGGTAAPYRNSINIYHVATGSVYFTVRDNTGGLIISQNCGAWSPTGSVEYEIEFNFDATVGAYRLFIDGTQKGATGSGTGTRDTTDCNLFLIGNGVTNNYYADGKFNDFLVFSTVQHTANYTPDWTNIFEYDYLESAVILPEMAHVGDGSILAIAGFSTSDTYIPRYTLQVGRSGDYLYWNGAAWVVSDGTYNQANDEVTFNLNCGSISVSGEKYGQFKVLFPDNNIQSAVDTLTVNVTANNGYLTTNPMLECNSTFRAEGLEGFSTVSTITGSDNIKFILAKDGVDYYHNGVDWVTSDGTYSQSNTAAEIHTNRATFTAEGVLVKVKIFFHSDTGATRPILSSITVTYDFAGGSGDTIETCVVWANQLDAFGNPSLETLTVETNKNIIQYKNSTMIKHEKTTITPDDTGYWEAELIETENMESGSKYVFKFANGEQYEKSVPNEATKNFWDLV